MRGSTCRSAWTTSTERCTSRSPGRDVRHALRREARRRGTLGGGNGPPALERLDRDVLERAGATHVIFFEGTNDIAGSGATAAQVIEGTLRVIERVKARGMKIYGATILPRGGPGGSTAWSSEKEAHRQAVNAWIRTAAPFDGVLDFAALLGGGPAIDGSESIRPEFNCDYTHPNEAGYRAMAEMIDAGWFVR